MPINNAWDTAQICENGHLINARIRIFPHQCSDFCQKCGNRTITSCKSCGTAIRGEILAPPAVSKRGHLFKIPFFCHKCGEPYPWTQKKLKELEEQSAKLHELSDREKQDFIEGVKEILAEGANKNSALLKVKEILGKMGKVSLEIAKVVLANILSQEIGKKLFEK